MTIRERARYLREQIELLAMSYMDDEFAAYTPELFPIWEEGVEYHIGDRRRYEGVLYKCVQDHTSRSDWLPADSVSLWTRILIPDPEVIPEWEQPISTNAYMMGDKVRHNGKVWVSTMDYNVFEPGVAGWEEVI